ncbi:phosphate ABC transporter membrane protein 1 (PhoT family) [Glaciihabitans tibetensis]|uniref:Phosphate transport system permease protein n=1 Tax=Glaciihabitans tibetensis TaxID=1266600 RepID=A0A2T0VBM8_9MICO|nr:phosphate ABC transporter permease subunit PstC [Glaciihabitans tibetensis]PRY67488.1 phosphate ABC transporter membrane protein 1 (PhoT family) [Glaciihabitans tibetensis]
MKDALDTAFGTQEVALIDTTAPADETARVDDGARVDETARADAALIEETALIPQLPGVKARGGSIPPGGAAALGGADTPPGGARRSFASRLSISDAIFRYVSYSAGIITVAIMLCVGLFLSMRAADALSVSGFSFLTEQAWSPETKTFGIAAVLSGTITIAIVGMCVSVPLALGTSLLISEIVSPRLKSTMVTLVDLMAAVPSVVFGLWGAFFLQANIIPISQWISTYFAWIPIFAVTTDGDTLTDASAFTSSAFIAGIVVGLMVVPTQTSVMREAFSQAPAGEREGALALGSTRWGMIREVVIPFGRGGIIGGTMLGLGRALGETIAVYMIISPVFVINWEVLKTGTNSVSALIALRYGESSEFGLSALMAAGLVLFAITLIINFTASSVVARSRSGAESEA